MTIDQAIRILDPATTTEELNKVYYYGGFCGNEAITDAINEATRIAVEVMRKYQEERQKMTLKEFCNLVVGDLDVATINVFKNGNREKYRDSETKGFKEFTFQTVFPADSILRDEYANAEVVGFWSPKRDVFDVEIEKLN